MALRKNIKLDKKDYTRALLCDTLPADCPIIFSNDGLYVNLADFEVNSKVSADFTPFSSFLKNIINPSLDLSIAVDEREQKKKKQSFPFGYCIVKDVFS
ncbi:TPA: reverse transcriptase, partial [Yersinia enterocolitica]|nr:reverse transcriptase [Yersinia enterocolitica]